MSSSSDESQCFGFHAILEVLGDFTVSQQSVNCLNLTQDITKYAAAYCTNPPRDDDCPFSFCPNPEIAGMNLIIYFLSSFVDCTLSGPLVRIASEYRQILVLQPLILSRCIDYVTSFCVGTWLTVVLRANVKWFSSP